MEAKYDIASLTEGYINTMEVWIVANLCVLSDSESPDEDRSVALGAAVWMLDHIEGDIVLPPEFEDSPDLYDPAHEDDLLRAATHLIRHRQERPEEFEALLNRIPEDVRTVAAQRYEEVF